MMRSSIFYERESWKGPVALSAGLHALFALTLVILGIWSGPHAEDWGGTSSGDAIQANLVSSAPVPLPNPQEQSQNIVANESKGLTQSVAQPVEEEPDAVPIPEKETKRKPAKTVTAAQAIKPVTPPQDNVVPFGAGGPVSGPYGAFTAANAKGGFSFPTDSNFGSRFAWYVQVVNNKVSNNWYTVEVGQSGSGHRVYILFDIESDGRPVNPRIEQSSGIPALDQSAIRAIQRIDTFGPTPSGGKVSVEFWFDLAK